MPHLAQDTYAFLFITFRTEIRKFIVRQNFMSSSVQKLFLNYIFPLYFTYVS